MTAQISIVPRAYGALVASACRIVMAQDAQPILASDIEPMLKGGFHRHELERALAKCLRGKLANDAADPEDAARKLIAILHEPEKDTKMNAKDGSAARRKTARDGLDSELQKVLRGKLSPREFETVMAALGGGNNSEDEPREDTDYARQQFSAVPPRGPGDDDVSSGMEDMGGNATIAKRGEFGKDSNDLSEKIMNLVGPSLTDEKRDGLQQLLDNLFGGEDEPTEDEPPDFPGKPLVGGKQLPLTTKQPRNPTPRSQAMDQSFAKRWPDAARLGPGEPQRQYRNGVPVPDERLLSGSTPTPRRVAAMDSAASVRSSKSFADRFPEVARIRVEG